MIRDRASFDFPPAAFGKLAEQFYYAQSNALVVLQVQSDRLSECRIRSRRQLFTDNRRAAGRIVSQAPALAIYYLHQQKVSQTI